MLRDHYPDALIGALGSLLPHDGEEVQHHVIGAVSYTHLTLPTIYSV